MNALSVDAVGRLRKAMELCASVERELAPVLRGDPPPADPVDLARRALRLRRRRERLFGAGLFSDPAWDILLDLLVAGAEQRAISVSSACLAGAGPATTGLRHLGMLERRGLVERVRAPGKSRRVHVRLTARAVAELSTLLLAA
ncbi:hypothetical protein PQ455_18170 [Sphingomonas naphthae]|uniref:HTH marR-type domain-containing protein n=1 Tax=Sphingomonas naphthae TaxID=1813468 RepID=A0ABY7TKN2_9SPHN|nr:hypothetical protein [Sphingomonas naphthae]WCT73508.1 hypothetical protein PQ455_18170 [Sphingomonas naphthae]